MKKFICFLLLLSLSACGKKPVPPKPMSMQVETIIAQKEKFYDSETYLAVLKSRQAVNLAPELTSKVENIFVQSGDFVKAGQLLIILKSDEELSSLNSQIALSQSKSQSIGTKEAQLKEAKANLEFAKSRYARHKKLQEQDLISKNQLEEYENALSKAQNNYNALQFTLSGSQDDLKQAQSGVQEKKARLNKLRITAPFSGIVQDIPAKIGDLVSPSMSLISIANTNNLEVYVNIPVDKAIKLKVGTEIDLVSSETDEFLGVANIFFISSTVDPNTQTVLLKANLKNTEGIFRDNQQVKCKVKFSQKEAFLIPSSLITRFGETFFVYTAIPAEQEVQTEPKDNYINKISKGTKAGRPEKGFTVKQKVIKVSKLIDNKNYEVISGLEEGEQIISNNIQKLAEGMSITIKAPEAQFAEPAEENKGEEKE